MVVGITELYETAFISFQEGKPFEAGKTFIAPLGEYSLRRINTNLARKVRGMRKDLNSLMIVEDGV